MNALHDRRVLSCVRTRALFYDTGTTFAATVPMGLAGSVAHFRRNNIHPRAAFWLSMATLSAMFIGSQFVANVDEHTLRQIFAGLLAVSAVRMIMN